MSRIDPPDPYQAIAEFHWYVNEIENKVLQAYWGNHARYAQLKTVLHAAWEDLSVPEFKMGNVDCPWPLCPNGECAPECNVPDMPAAHSKT